MMCRPILNSMLRAAHYFYNHDLDIVEWRMSAVSFAVLHRNVLRQEVRRSIYLRNEYTADDQPLLLLGAPIIIDERVPCRRVEIVPRLYICGKSIGRCGVKALASRSNARISVVIAALLRT